LREKRSNLAVEEINDFNVASSRKTLLATTVLVFQCPASISSITNHDIIRKIDFTKFREGKKMKFLIELPWGAVIFLCLTLGLAPFAPPHIYEKLRMLMRGELVRPIDWFDLFLHASPWVLLVLKAVVTPKGQ
jgi:hypothetical protein